MARKKPIPRSARKAINRGTLRSRKKDEVKNISVGLMDIDSAIMYYFNNVIKPMLLKMMKQLKYQLCILILRGGIQYKKLDIL